MTTMLNDEGMLKVGLFLDTSCSVLEYVARFFYCNLPTYIVGHFVEVDRLSCIVLAYLLLQVVAFLWAFLLNASFSLGLRTFEYIVAVLFTMRADEALSPKMLVTILATMYVSYASMRVSFGFASSIFGVALESLKDFPDAAKYLTKGGKATLSLSTVVFIPAIFLELCLVFSDRLCNEDPDYLHALSTMSSRQHHSSMASNQSSKTSWLSYLKNDLTLGAEIASGLDHVRSGFCTHTGISILTSQFPEIRRLVFYTLWIMMTQIWQAHLTQFSRWDQVFQAMPSPFMRMSFQIGVLILALLSLIASGLLLMPNIPVAIVEESVTMLMLGWTVWLCAFTPTLHAIRGDQWVKEVTPVVTFNSGYLEAQLDLTFITVTIPLLYCGIYLMARLGIKGGWALQVGAPLAFALSLIVSSVAGTQGNGSIILVFFHILGKGVNFFGSDDEADSFEEDETIIQAVQEGVEGGGGGGGGEGLVEHGQGRRNHRAGSLSSGASEEEDDYKLDGCVDLGEVEVHEKEAAATAGEEVVQAPEVSPPPSIPQTRVRRVRGDVKAGENSTETAAASGATAARAAAGGGGGDDAHNAQTSSLPRSTSSQSDETTSIKTRSSRKKSGGTIAAGGDGSSGGGGTKLRKSRSLDASKILHAEQLVTAGGGDEQHNFLLSHQNLAKKASSDALKMLNERKDPNSALISMDFVGDNVRNHKFVKGSKKMVSFFGNAARTLAGADTLLNGVIRLFCGLGLFLAIAFSTISFLSCLQDNNGYFPEFIHYSIDASDGSFKFDHKISNVTMCKAPPPISPFAPPLNVLGIVEDSTFSSSSSLTNESCTADSSKCIDKNAAAAKKQKLKIKHVHQQNNRQCGQGSSSSNNKNNKNSKNTKSSGRYDVHQSEEEEEEEPIRYASCEWRWNTLSQFDFALLSEAAYFKIGPDMQAMIDYLMPDMGFVVVAPKNSSVAGERENSGPKYLELASEKLNVTVLAVRGTDVGRLHDLMEDVKLYAEPVIFTLLSAVFPTIRLWTHDTTSRVIEWLYEFNSFFGLQGEAEYYRPLAQRVLEIAKNNSSSNVIITGHSLGGGLARIVGTLTGVASVSFSPPGLGLSYRKYSLKTADGQNITGASREGAIHHQSLAVVTEFDWITQIDHQVGLVQMILCDKREQAHLLGCHLLEGTICHLLKHCGDDKHRFQKCDYDFDVSVVVPSMMQFAYDHALIILPSVGVVIMILCLAVLPDLV